MVDNANARAGAWSGLTGGTAALLSRCGADFVVLDAQHGFYDAGSLAATLLHWDPVVPVFVRVADRSPAGIGRVLDLGASGVIVPLVDDPGQAAAVAACCRYPPRGNRSWGPMTGLVGRSVPAPAAADAGVVCGVMVETSGGLAAVDAIAATAGVDMVFVGPFDLSLGLGVNLEDMVEDTSVDSPLSRVVRACESAGVRSAVYAGNPERAHRLRRFGFTDVVVLTDAALLADAATVAFGHWRATAAGDV